MRTSLMDTSFRFLHFIEKFVDQIERQLEKKNHYNYRVIISTNFSDEEANDQNEVLIYFFHSSVTKKYIYDIHL